MIEKLNQWITDAKNYYETYYATQNVYYNNLYNSKRIKAANIPKWRSNNFIPVTFASVETEKARLVSGLIGNGLGDFFIMLAKDSKDDNSAALFTEAQKVHMRMGKFYTHLHDSIHIGLKYGVGWIKQTWETRTEKHDYIQLNKGKPTKKTNTKEIDRPKWEAPSVVWWDKDAVSMETMRYVIEPIKIPLSEVLANESLFNGKDVKKMASDLRKGNKDNDPILDIYMVYTPKNFYAKCNDYILRDTVNPYAHGHIPFYPFRVYPDAEKFGGKGLPEILSDINESMNEVHNLTLDNVKLAVNKIYGKKRTSSTKPQSTVIEPGKIIPLDNKDDFFEIANNPVNQNGFQQIEQLNGFVNQSIGSLDYINAPTGIGNQNKTAAGARIIVQEANKRFAQTIEYNKENMLIPMLYDLLELYRQYWGTENLEVIANKETIKKYGKDICLDAEYDYVVTGNVSLLDKEAQLENIQRALGILGNLGVQLDAQLLAEQVLKSLGLDTKILVKPAPQEAAPQVDPVNEQAKQAAMGMTPEQKAEIVQIANALQVPPEEIVKRLVSGEKIEDIKAQVVNNG